MKTVITCGLLFGCLVLNLFEACYANSGDDSVSKSPLTITESKDFHFNSGRVKITEDGRFAYAAKENKVFVSDGAKVEVIEEIELKNSISDFAVSPNGQCLVVYSGGRVIIWNIQEKRQLKTWKVVGRPVFAFNSSGTQLALAAGNVIKLIDCATGALLGGHFVSKGTSYPRVWALTFNPVGDSLFATTDSGDVYRLAVADLQTGVKPWTGFTRYGSMAISQDGRRIAVSRNAGYQNATQIVLVDAVSGESLFSHPLKTNLNKLGAMAFTADGNHLIAAGTYGELMLWNITTGERLAKVSTGSRSFLVSMHFSPGASRLNACERPTRTGTICHSWKLAVNVAGEIGTQAGGPATPQLTLTGGEEFPVSVISLANSIDFKTAKAIIEPAGDLIFRNSEGATRILQRPDTSRDSPQAVFYWDSVVSAGGRIITAPLNHQQLALFDFQSGTLLNVLEVDGPHGFLSNGGLAVVQGNMGVQVFEPESGRHLYSVDYPMPGYIAALAAASKHPVLIVAPAKGAALYGRVEASKISFKPMSEVHLGPVTSISISPDEQLIANGGADGRIQLYELESGIPRGETWPGHDVAVTAMAFNPDSSLLVSGYADGSIRLWDVETGRAISKVVIAHSAPVLGLVFDSRSGQVISITNEQRLRKWIIPERQIKYP